MAESEVYAVDDRRTHEDASLNKGSLHGDCVKCPLHGSRFRPASGETLDDPAEEVLNTYPVKISGNDTNRQQTGYAKHSMMAAH